MKLASLAALAGFLVSIAASQASPVPASAPPLTRAPLATGLVKYLYITVDFPDAPGIPSRNRSEATPEFIAAGVRDVAAFYAKSSSGALTLDVTIVPQTLRLQRTKAHYLAQGTPDELAQEARAAAAAYDATQGNTGHYNPAQYDGCVYLYSEMAGAASFSGGAFAGQGHIWIGGNFDEFYALAHEFGHALGLPHAQAWRPSSTDPLGAGTAIEYGDPFDVMGGGTFPGADLNVISKHRLGFVSDADVLPVTATGTYRLHAHDDGINTGTKALKIVLSGREYWLEFKRHPGFVGSKAKAERLRHGVLVRLKQDTFPDGGSSNGSFLINASGIADPYLHFAPLTVGESYVDASRTLRIVPLATGNSGSDYWIDVRVVLTNTTPAAPAISQENVAATATLDRPQTYAVTASASGTSFVSARWNFSDGEIADGLSVQHTWRTAGTHTVQCTVFDDTGGKTERSWSVAVSPKLVTWTMRSLPNGMTALAFDGERFVAVATGSFLHSTDGLVWNYGTGSIARLSTYHAVVGTEGRSVAVGSGNPFDPQAGVPAIAYSADGKAWIDVSPPVVAGTLCSVAHAKGVYVAVGDNGLMYTSANGQNWTKVATGTSSHLGQVAGADAGFVATGEGGVVLHSVDGQTWTKVIVSFDSNQQRSVYHAQDAWTIASQSYTYRSTDGLNWNAVDTIVDDFANLRTLGHYLPSLGRYVAIDALNGNFVDPAISHDGQHWTPLGLTPGNRPDSTIAARPLGIAEGNGNIVMLASGGLIYHAGSQAIDIATGPASGEHEVGSRLALSATVQAGNTLTYQWFKNGTAIAGATTSRLLIPSITFDDAGSYSVVASDGNGYAVSAPATIGVFTLAPVIRNETGSGIFEAGAATVLSGQVEGVTPLQYQWFKDGQPLAGATTASLSLADLKLSDSGVYHLVATNTHGSKSGVAHGVKVFPSSATAPAITVQPQDATVMFGHGCIFMVVAQGSPTLRYQWYRNGTALTGETSSRLFVYAANDTTGKYSVEVANAFGSLRSREATLTASVPTAAPSLVFLPASLEFASGDEFTFEVCANGTEPLEYKLQDSSGFVLRHIFRAFDAATFTQNTFTLGAAGASSAGDYYVVVSNAAGEVRSGPIPVTVGAPTGSLRITGNSFLENGAVGSTIHRNFILANTGGGPVTIDDIVAAAPYAVNWRSAVIPAGESATLTVTFAPTTTGYFGGLIDIVATNNAGQRILGILGAGTQPPAIATHPQSQAAAAGTTVTLTAATAGPAPATVQWQRNGRAVTGATSATLSLAALQPAQAGLYTAVLSDTAASSTTAAAIVGAMTTEAVLGDGAIVGTNILHANGKRFDQVLVTGAAESITAAYTADRITRTSFVDLNDDIVQVEFAGPGTLSLVLDGISGPAEPLNYNQNVSYMKGHAGLVIVGADERTNVTIFTVGRATAGNQALFKDDAPYDGIADIAYVAIHSANGNFGGLRSANARYWATSGFAGVYAPGVAFQGPVFVGDISAYDSATPTLRLGSAADVRITGGALLQDNGRAVEVSGISTLQFAAGSDSHGNLFPAQPNQAVLVQDGENVTAELVND